MRHLPARAAALGLFVVLTGCGNHQTPQHVVDSLVHALNDGDCAAVKHLVVTPSAIDCATITETAGTFADEGIDVDKVHYRVGPIVDDSSTVKVIWGNGTPAESFDVQRVAGAWRVVFDSAA